MSTHDYVASMIRYVWLNDVAKKFMLLTIVGAGLLISQSPILDTFPLAIRPVRGSDARNSIDKYGA